MTDSLILACPACSTLNRFPREKLEAGNAGKCGQCGSPLFAGRPVALDARSFEAHAAKSDSPVLVDVWAGVNDAIPGAVTCSMEGLHLKTSRWTARTRHVSLVC